MRRRLTVEEKAARLEKREAARTAHETRVGEQRAWLESRADEAKKRVAKAKWLRARRLKKAAKKAPKQPQVTILKHERSRDRGHRGGSVIDSTLGTSIIRGGPVTANHSTRRSMGARGKPRQLRRRELPGAEQRRLERARKAWVS